MEPTHSHGSLLRSGGRPSSWLRGDVVVLRVPQPHRRELKRVIGLPGERVAWNGQGAIWINAQRLREPYAQFGPAVPGDEEVRHITLGDGEYFVAGDSRLHSTDSRRYGAVRREQLMERIFA